VLTAGFPNINFSVAQILCCCDNLFNEFLFVRFGTLQVLQLLIVVLFADGLEGPVTDS
jgi:hypothetical protein